MKNCAVGFFVIFFALVIGVMVPISAQAALCVTDISLTADCYSYKITIDAGVNMDYLPTIVVTYSLFLDDGAGNVAEISDTFPITPSEEMFVYEHTADWGVKLCGQYTVHGELNIARPDGYVKWTEILEPVVLDCPCGCPPGTGTPGYWKNHPEAWPGDVMIGGIPYTIDNAIFWMNQPDNKDKTITMFSALVAAVLNVAVGNESDCIDDTIAAAHEWMAMYGPVGSGVAAGGKDSPWRCGEPLYCMLDQYNNGLLCAPSRDTLEGVGKLAQQSAAELEAAPTLQNYPNPFNPVTTIAFNMPKAEKATLTVYNILGEKIATLADGYYAAGQHSVTWNATGLASGIYFYRFEAGSFEITNKLLFAK